MEGTPFNVQQYLRLRKEIMLRKPFFISYKEYLVSYFQNYLFCCFKKINTERLIQRRKLFLKAQKKLIKSFDGVKLIKSIRKFNIMKSIMLEKR